MSQPLPSVVAAPVRRAGGPRRWRAADRAAHLAAFAARGGTVPAYCAEAGVPPSTFFAWQREARAAPAPPASALRRPPPPFARVEVVPTPARPGLTLVVRGPAGREAEVTGLDAATVVTLLQVVLRAGAR